MALTSEYDVAVIYPEKLLTSRWHKMFKKFLYLAEHQWGLRLFIFDRDAKAGATIADNWDINLEKSRKVLLFATSKLDDWCDFATKLAHAFSPAGKRAHLGIVEFEKCKQLDCFRLFKTIDYTTKGGKEYFWINIYKFCTGNAVTKESEIPGIPGSASTRRMDRAGRASTKIHRRDPIARSRPNCDSGPPSCESASSMVNDRHDAQPPVNLQDTVHGEGAHHDINQLDPQLALVNQQLPQLSLVNQQVLQPAPVNQPAPMDQPTPVNQRVLQPPPVNQPTPVNQLVPQPAPLQADITLPDVLIVIIMAVAIFRFLFM